MVATALPFIAACHGEMGALPGKGPTVMKGPDRGDAVLFYIAEQHRNIKIASVKIVEVNNIGFESGNL